MKELEVKIRDYIRTNYGICQITDIKPYKTKEGLKIYVDKQTPSLSYHISEKSIVKSSHDIMDLIEVGDLVNGYIILKIEDIKNSNKKMFTLYETGLKRYCEMLSEEDIKSIVTHEQLKNIEYRVEV